MIPEALDSLSKKELIAIILAQAEMIEALQARIAQLEAKLGEPPKTPDNSSMPPSSGRKANRPARSGDRRKGRKGTSRKLAENPDHVRDVFTATCPHCDASASPADQPDVRA